MRKAGIRCDFKLPSLSACMNPHVQQKIWSGPLHSGGGAQHPSMGPDTYVNGVRTAQQTTTHCSSPSQLGYAPVDKSLSSRRSKRIWQIADADEHRGSSPLAERSRKNSSNFPSWDTLGSGYLQVGAIKTCGCAGISHPQCG